MAMTILRHYEINPATKGEMISFPGGQREFYSTGKLLIGSRHTARQSVTSADAEYVQRVLLDKKHDKLTRANRDRAEKVVYLDSSALARLVRAVMRLWSKL
jgi:hypothetical protein